MFLRLLKTAKPSVRIDKVMTLYQKGESASFTCNVLGLPSPNITWIIAKYPDFSSKDNPVLTHPSASTNQWNCSGSSFTGFRIPKTYSMYIWQALSIKFANPDIFFVQNLTIKPGEKGPYHLVSTVNVITNETVGVTCKSCNAIACDHSTKQVLVSGNFNYL